MGDGADMALDRASMEVEHYERFKDEPIYIQYEEGLIDEMGGTIGNPSSMPFARSGGSRKPSGPGECPICGNATKLRNGKFGDFYGCGTFPHCKGSRNV